MSIRDGGYLGIVDWGIGGLGLYQKLKKRADYPIMYFSDSGHMPYGKTQPTDLNARLQQVVNYLFDHGARYVAIACNAANAAYEDRDRVSGIITHGVKILRNGRWGNVGLLAGRVTVNSRVYHKKLSPLSFKLHQRISQPLSAHVEAGRLSGKALHQDLESIMGPLSRCDAILLACTHYPAIEGEIRRYVAKDCAILDPAEEMADWICRSWDLEPQSGEDVWMTTGNDEQLMTNGKLAFNVDIPQVRKVSL